jgi:hypothetical protein
VTGPVLEGPVTSHVRYRRASIIVALASIGSFSCGSVVSDAEAEQIAAACEQTRALHNRVTDAANVMAAAEVGATPADRATILAEGLDAMIAAVATAELPTEPASLVQGLTTRRDRVVDEMRSEAGAFRSEWPTVSGEERQRVVPLVFVWGEKLMSETEPRLPADADTALVEAIRAEQACRHVIQLPTR